MEWGAISWRPSAACNLHGRQPVFPHRRINRRPISPFQAAYEKLDLPGGLALTPPNNLKEGPHRIVAFDYSDRIGRFHDGYIFGHACPSHRRDRYQMRALLAKL